jgi:hypothetical protein
LGVRTTIEHIGSTAVSTESRAPKPLPPFAVRLGGAVFAIALLSGVMPLIGRPAESHHW